MIREDEVYQIGVVTRTHGIRGEVAMAFTDDVWDRAEADYLVLRIDGILVPFFMEEYRFRSDSVALVKFCDIDTQERARELTGCDVFFPRALAADDEAPLSLNSLVGFDIVEETLRNGCRVLSDLREVAPARERLQPLRELVAERGTSLRLAIVRILDHQRQVGDRYIGHDAPAIVGHIHACRGKAHADGHGPARFQRRQFEGCVRDAAVLVHGAARLDVVPHHDALHLASAGVLRPGDARGGVELDVACGKDIVDRVKKRRLARTIVAEQEQMPAARQVNDSSAQIVEVHEPDANYLESLTCFHLVRI